MTSGGCTIGIRSGNKATSTCPEVYEFAIKSASTSSGAHPCTNSPIRCILCQDVHWKYNMEQHLRDRHPKWELTKSREDREAFSSTFAISDLERRNLGVVEVSPPSLGQSESADGSVGDARGQKRLPVSPAGTPRRSRILRISAPGSDGSRTVTVAISSKPVRTLKTVSDSDIFT
jgi:hypothetical protein